MRRILCRIGLHGPVVIDRRHRRRIRRVCTWCGEQVRW